MVAGNDLLRLLEATHAFDPVALPGYRTSLYVEFETLTGDACETHLAAAVENAQRVAVIGPVGSGKSSLIEYVFGSRLNRLAPMWVSAAHEAESTLIDPVEFARHVIRQIARWAAEVGAMSSAEERDTIASSARSYAGFTSTRTETIGVKLGKWIEPSWAREIQETLANPEVERSGAQLLASLDDLVTFVYEQGLTPVVIVDDSDRWLTTSAKSRDALLGAFFGETARMLAERNWGVVLAVQPEYCAAPAFRRTLAEGFLDSQVSVPALPNPAALRLILDERVVRRARDADEDARGQGESAVFGDVRFLDVFEPEAEAILFDRYRDGNLRPVLTVSHQALCEAVRVGDEKIFNRALREMVLALS
jgi:hypothetical protein